MQISKYPLDPITPTGSPLAPSANVGTIFFTTALPALIVQLPCTAASAGTSSTRTFVIKFPNWSTRSTTPRTVLPTAFGRGRENRVKSVIGSPNADVCQDFENHAATGAKTSRP